MKWADFEAEREVVRKNLARVQSASEKVSYPPASSRDQVTIIKDKQANIKNVRGRLIADITASMARLEEITQVSVPWDMPDMPQAAKKMVRAHNENVEKVKGMRDAFRAEWRRRRSAIKGLWTGFDD